MKKKYSSLVAVVTAALLALTGCSSSSSVTSGDVSQSITRDFVMGTGGTGGTFYPLGGELAKIFADNVEDITVNPVETSGGTDNLGQLFQGNHQLGMSSNDITNMAVDGTLDGLDGIKMDNFGWISALYPEATHVIVRAESGIETFEDLRGRKIAVGNAGSGTRAISDALFEAYDMVGEYTPEVTDFATSTDMLADGQIDASIFVVGVPVSGLTQLSATTDVALIPIDASIIAKLTGEGSHLETYDISTESYGFLKSDVPTISVFSNLLASLDTVSDDDAYGITKALFENVDKITLEVGRSIKLENALKGIGEVPLHPGAARYYAENGIELP